MITSPEEFMNFEEKNNMFEKKIHGIFYWHLIRFELYSHILCIQLNHKSRHPDLEFSKKAHLKSVINLLLNSIKNCRRKVDKNRILISGSSAKSNKKIELIIGLGQDKFVYLNRPANYLHEIVPQNTQMIYPDFIEFLRGCSIVLEQHNAFLKKAVKEEIKEWIETLNQDLGIYIDFNTVERMVIYAYVSVKVLCPYFNRLLKKINPSRIVIDTYYERFNLALILSAKKLGIEVDEYQHGTINKCHIAYNLKRLHDRYLPDHFLLFGDYWRDTLIFPDKNRMIIAGSLEMEKRTLTHSFKNLDTSTKTILFISQGPYTDYMYPFAVSLADHLDKKNIKYKILYKLHPNEIYSWKTLHKEYCDERIVLETGNLYDLFETVDYQIGINSTAIFEGFAFKKITMIIDCDYLAESEMREVCEQGYATLVRDAKDVENVIRSNDHNCPDSDYFWYRNAEDAYKKYFKIQE